MEEIVLIIEQALKSSKLKSAVHLRNRDPHDIAYNMLVIMEDTFGKTRPEGKWKSFKALAGVCGQLGRDHTYWGS